MIYNSRCPSNHRTGCWRCVDAAERGGRRGRGVHHQPAGASLMCARRFHSPSLRENSKTANTGWATHSGRRGLLKPA